MRPVKVSASDFYGGVCIEFGSQKVEQIRVLSWSDLDSRGVLVGKLQKIIEDVFSAGAASAMRLAGSVAKVAAAEFCFTVRSKGKNRSAVFLTKSTLGPALDPFFVEVNDIDGDPSQIEVVAK